MLLFIEIYRNIDEQQAAVSKSFIGAFGFDENRLSLSFVSFYNYILVSWLVLFILTKSLEEKYCQRASSIFFFPLLLKQMYYRKALIFQRKIDSKKYNKT